MNLPIYLSTAFGMEQFSILGSQFADYSNRGLREEFRERCRNDLTIQEKYLEYFLESEEMSARYKLNEEDVVGFKIFNEHSDVCSCLKYYSERKY